jgi:hypothetical protein
MITRFWAVKEFWRSNTPIMPLYHNGVDPYAGTFGHPVGKELQNPID